MPKRGDNIYQRKDGRWEGRYLKSREKGKRRLGYVFASTYADAKEKLAAAKAVWLAENMEREQEKETLEVVSGQWLEDAGKFLKESTVFKYRKCLEYYILPRFGEKSMHALTTEDVRLFMDMLLAGGGAHGQGLSSCTVSGVRCVLKMLRDYAKKQGYAVGYSTDGLAVRQKAKPLRVFDKQEVSRLRTYLWENLTPCHAGILLCLSTGIRLGEVCALRWDDISLDERELRIRRTLQRLGNGSKDAPARTKIIMTLPKSNSSVRVVPLTDVTIRFLSPFYREGAYLLTGDSERACEPRRMQKRFKRVLEICGIEDANFHTLRHTFATRSMEAGFDPKCLSEILGHSDVHITLNRYVHPTMETKRRNMAKMI